MPPLLGGLMLRGGLMQQPLLLLLRNYEQVGRRCDHLMLRWLLLLGNLVAGCPTGLPFDNPQQQQQRACSNSLLVVRLCTAMLRRHTAVRFLDVVSACSLLR
jgi:hypothetical protein